MMSRLPSRVKRHPLATFFVLKRPGRRVAIAALVVILRTRSLSELRELGSRMIRWRVRWYWYATALGFSAGAVMPTAGLNGGGGEPA